ncbi:MAG: hypothetical protein ACOYMT_06975 [Chthoniobacterales bacterium]
MTEPKTFGSHCPDPARRTDLDALRGVAMLLGIIRTQGLDAALEAPMVPEPSRAFMKRPSPC